MQYTDVNSRYFRSSERNKESDLLQDFLEHSFNHRVISENKNILRKQELEVD